MRRNDSLIGHQFMSTFKIVRESARHLEREISSFDRMLDGIQMVLGPKRGIESS